MKLLFISDNFPPETNAPATRTYEHCREWAKSGAKVTVITCAPNFPQGRVYPGYKNRIYRQEMMDGIKVVRVWSYITANEGFLRRIVDYASFALSSFLSGLFVESDVIVATSPQFFTTVSAFCLSKIKRRPWVFELRDLWPESIKAVGAMDNSSLINLLEKVELHLYRKSTLIIGLTESFKKNLVSRGIGENKIKIVTNGCNLERFYPREKNKEILRKINLDGKFIVGYIGTHGMAHSLDFIVNSVAKIDDDDLHFLFVGDGAKREEILRIARERNLTNVTFLNPASKDEVPEYLSIIDVALVPLKRSETFKTVLPSKIFESAAMGKPILLGVDGQAREIVEKYRAGISFEPENEKDFIEKVRVIKKDIKLYQNLQEGCMRLSNAFDRKTLAHKMYEYLEEIVKEPG